MRYILSFWLGVVGALHAAELFGTVRDTSNLPVSGVTVEALEQRTGLISRTTTSDSGEYHFLSLPPGTYTLVASKPRFATLHRSGVELRVADRISLELQLRVGEIEQSVDVTGEAPLLQTTSGTESFVVDATKVTTLPLDGRNFVPLIALAPGVALPPGSVLPRINGSRPRTNAYIYDGISVLQPEPGQVAYYPIIDAIAEFRVQINSYSAEYGRSNGGAIQVSTKSGTNEFHGTLFEFFRNEAMNARNLFALPGPNPPFKRNQYGFVVGGPIQKSQTFFFVDWQGTRLRIGSTKTSTVPTSLQRQGIFPTVTIPVNEFDRTALALLAHYPLPNVFVNGKEAAANNFRRLGIDRTNADQFDTRLDRYFGERHRVFGRYTYLRDHSEPGTPLPDGSGNITSGVIGDTRTRADSVVADYAYTRSAMAVNQFRFGFSRRGFVRSNLSDMPIYQIAGFQQLGPTESANSNFTTSVTQLIDTYSMNPAGHSLKFGADVRLERLDVLQPPDSNGLYSFISLPAFLRGEVNAFNIDIQQQTLKPRAKIAEFFVHDDWKATQRLSVALGLRYTLNFPSTEANDRGAVFDLNTQRLNFLGKDGFSRSARRLDGGDFGPRISLAFKASDSFVIRSGYGLVWIEQAGITTPFTVPFFPFIQSVGQRSQDNIHPAFLLSQAPSIEITPPNPDSGLGQGVFAVQSDTKSGYMQQWNFTLQKTLGKDWSVEAGYLGAKLTNLGVPDTNLNQLPAADLALGSQLTEQVANPFPIGGPAIARQQLLRPFPRFNTVTLFRNNIGNSTYHALQAHVEKRFSKRLTLTGSYTFSKLIDDASSVFDAAILTGPVANFPVADSFNRRLEKDVSNGDIPHVFSFGYVYALPRGWTLAGLVRIQSGMPVAVTQVTNFNSFAGYGTQRPNRVGDLQLDDPSVTKWFNIAAFAIAPQFVIGNSSRNPVRGPGYQDADIMLGKTFVIAEGVKLEFRAEVFNVSNTPGLGQPNGVAGTAAFGSITSASDPRVFEVGVKIHF